MRMHGSWHIYRPGERWQRPPRDDARARRRPRTSSRSASTSRTPSSRRARRRRARRDRAPRAGPARAGLRRGGGHAAAARARGDSRSPRRCSISARWPASATSSSRRCCSRAACIRSRRSTRARGRRLPALVDDRAAASSPPTSATRPPRLRPPDDRAHGAERRPVGLRPRRPALPALRHADRVREAGLRRASDVLVSALPAGLPRSSPSASKAPTAGVVAEVAYAKRGAGSHPRPRRLVRPRSEVSGQSARID